MLYDGFLKHRKKTIRPVLSASGAKQLPTVSSIKLHDVEGGLMTVVETRIKTWFSTHTILYKNLLCESFLLYVKLQIFKKWRRSIVAPENKFILGLKMQSAMSVGNLASQTTKICFI